MKNLCTFVLLAWASTNGWAHNPFDINTIQNIRTAFPRTDWNYMLNSYAQAGSNYLFKAPEIINEVKFVNIKVKNKDNNPQNYFPTKLDYTTNQDYDQIFSDGVWGATAAISNVYTQHYIHTKNVNTTLFSPKHAECEFHELVTTTNVNIGDIVINEFMASDSTTQADQNGEFDDWIEFHNNTNTPINLQNYYFSDSYINPQKWQFPDTTIAANGYLIVWADNDTFQTGLHAYFKLNAAGERLILSAPNGTVLDSVSFDVQTADVSISRIPNGTGAFVATPTSTFSANNSPVGVEKTISEAQNWTCRLYPVPATASLATLEVNSAQNSDFEYQVMDNLGRLLSSGYLLSVQGSATTHLSISNWAAGAYFVRIIGDKSSQILKLIVQ